MEKQQDIPIRLVNYSLFASGVLAFSNPVSGQAIYTDIDPDIILTEDGEWKYIDLDNDGLDDVGLQFSLVTTTSWSVVLGHFNIELTGENKMAIVYGDPCLLYSSFYEVTCYIEMHSVADVFSSGNQIGPSNDWGQINRVKYSWQCGPYGDACSQNYFQNHSSPVDEQFFAFRLLEPDLNYCWLRLYWADEELLLTGYACDTTGNLLHILVPEETDTQNELNQSVQFNVTNNILHIHSDIFIDLATISIFDLSGKMVFNATFGGTEMSIQLSAAKGLYLVWFNSSDTELTRKILLK